MNKVRHILYFLFALLLCSSLSYAAPLGSKKVSASDLEKIESEARKASQERQKIEQQANKVKNEVDALNQKMIAAAKQIQQGEDEVQQKQSELEKLQEHLAESEANFSKDHDMLIETLSALQNLALRPSAAILVQPLSPVEVMRSSILLRGGVHALDRRAEFIRQGIEDINNQRKEIAEKIEELAQKNEVLSKQQDDLQILAKQKNELYGQLSTQSKEAKAKATQLAGQAKNVRDLLDKLEKQNELQRKQMAEKEKLAKQNAADNLRSQRESAYASKSTSTGFSRAKGRLTRPARGYTITKFHDELSKGVVSNGIDIKTVSKAQVIAPYDGTVMFAGPFKNFDNLVIIDHGDGYTSLLSGLAKTDTEVGQTLLAGEPVGIMPSGNNVKLHMEIRKNNHPLDPDAWMSK
ncbi:MAG: peptidoglycan DD-metalloendopeptidase family protein [Alphaproteobacteria bacterium]|nr:peptidoglycan DD-metalloendopeptidase family protein [Alphaproteobacteria bacterium]